MVKRIRTMLTETNNSNHLKQFELLCNSALRVLSYEVKMFDSKISILLGIWLLLVSVFTFSRSLKRIDLYFHTDYFCYSTQKTYFNALFSMISVIRIKLTHETTFAAVIALPARCT